LHVKYPHVFDQGMNNCYQLVYPKQGQLSQKLYSSQLEPVVYPDFTAWYIWCYNLAFNVGDGVSLLNWIIMLMSVPSQFWT